MPPLVVGWRGWQCSGWLSADRQRVSAFPLTRIDVESWLCQFGVASGGDCTGVAGYGYDEEQVFAAEERNGHWGKGAQRAGHVKGTFR